MSDPTSMSKKDVLKFTDLIPGLTAVLARLPKVIRNIKAGLSIQGDDRLSIGRVLEENALKYANRPAVFYEDQQLSHKAFNEKVNQYAHFFLEQGVQRQEVVVVLLENRLELLIMISAMAKIGAIASLINSNQRGKVLLHSITVDPGKYIVVGEEMSAAFEAITPQLDNTAIKLFGIKDKGQSPFPSHYTELEVATANYSSDNPSITQEIQAKDRFANVFTSGTTGLPKASIQTHKKWLTCLHWFGRVNMNLKSSDVIYISIPFFHTNALIVAWPSAAASGAAVAIRRKFSVTNFWKDVIKYNASSFIYIGEVCRYLLSAPPSELDQKHRVRKIIGNGLRPEIWKIFKKRFNIKHVVELYGAADGTSSFTNTFNIDCTVGWCPSKYAIVKYDIENEEIFRNTAGFMEQVAKGEAGLLITEISTKLPFAGYTNKEENEKKILANVFEPGDQWFNTGDLLRDIGFKHAQFVDRLGDTFRWKGENVSTAEVEGMVNAFEQVQEATVYGVKIPNTDGRAGMIALIPKVREEEFDFAALHAFLKEKLPTYAIPLVIRISKDFDRTATHKIKKYRFKQEGMDLNACTEPIYIHLPKSGTYTKLDIKKYQAIEAGQYTF